MLLAFGTDRLELIAAVSVCIWLKPGEYFLAGRDLIQQQTHPEIRLWIAASLTFT